MVRWGEGALVLVLLLFLRMLYWQPFAACRRLIIAPNRRVERSHIIKFA